MLDKAFKLTSKDLIKLSLMIVVATVLFGLPGLLMMLFLQWITRQTYALDSAQKHGISHMTASRLGGAAIFGFSFILLILSQLQGLISLEEEMVFPSVVWVTIIGCMAIGLIDDLNNNLLSPRARLLGLFIFFSVCMTFWPSLIPSEIGIFGLDSLLSFSVFAWVITVFFCIGFVNAINMADGANGLMPGTMTIAFIVFYLETSFMLYAVLITTCGLFTIFNVISGRLFLGDAGAYGLGSILVLSGLYVYSEALVSAPFLAVLFGYPCLEILVTVIRRVLSSKSVFLPDNDHLHNRIHFHCQRYFPSRTVANSMTGILIVLCSVGVALLGINMQWIPVTSDQWLWIFLIQCVVYSVSYFYLGANHYKKHRTANDLDV